MSGFLHVGLRTVSIRFNAVVLGLCFSRFIDVLEILGSFRVRVFSPGFSQVRIPAADSNMYQAWLGSFGLRPVLF